MTGRGLRVYRQAVEMLEDVGHHRVELEVSDRSERRAGGRWWRVRLSWRGDWGRFGPPPEVCDEDRLGCALERQAGAAIAWVTATLTGNARERFGLAIDDDADTRRA